jgi:DMSO reductase family type II enzyme chaperone
VPQIENLETAEELQAAARSRLYDLLARAFAVPDAPFYQAVREGTFAAQVCDNLVALPYAFALADREAARQQLAEAGGHRELQSEYIRLFDVGTPRPPCPLYGGEYKKGRKGIMEELIRFYNYFGLRPSPRSRDMPDHITIELEFMHFLTFREVTVLHHRQDRSSYLRAERDFLERQLCAWVPRLNERLRRQQPHPFYAALVGLAEAFLAADLRYLQGVLQPYT